MTDAQRKAVQNYRRRLRDSGLERFEVRGREADKDLVRAVAKRLAEGGATSGELRATIEARVNQGRGERGGVLKALRRSPLVGAELELTRETLVGREVDL
ncbi:MAG: hypothetical protein ACREEB_01635 [Caulobacteraceae bacterium]